MRAALPPGKFLRLDYIKLNLRVTLAVIINLLTVVLR